MDFARQFDEALKNAFTKAGLSEEERELALRNLERALILNFCGRAYALLPPEQQRALDRKDLRTLDDALQFMSGSIPQEKLREAFAGAVGEVMGDFIDRATG